MTLTITIEMDYPAFEDNQGREVSRILKLLVAQFDGQDSLKDEYVSLRDYNGNNVGKATVEE